MSYLRPGSLNIGSANALLSINKTIRIENITIIDSRIN
jgi:hypothetical protein